MTRKRQADPALIALLAEKAAAYETARFSARREAIRRAEESVLSLRLDLMNTLTEALRKGESISRIADAIGIGRSTIYKYKNEYAQIRPGATTDACRTCSTLKEGETK